MQETSATPPSTPPLRPWLSRLRRGLGVLLVLVLSLIGLLALVLHLVILPRIDSFRPALENLASRTLGTPLEIGQLHVTERGWNPTIAMDNIVLRDGQGAEGLPARVQVQGGAGRRLSGKVLELGRAVRSKSRLAPVPVIDVLVSLEGDTSGLKTGMPVSVDVTVPAARAEAAP